MAIANNNKIGFVYVGNLDESFATTTATFKNNADSSIIFYPGSQEIAIGNNLIANYSPRTIGINMGTTSGSGGDGLSVSGWISETNGEGWTDTHNQYTNRCVNDAAVTFICAYEDGTYSNTIWENEANFPIFFPRYANLEYVLVTPSLSTNGILTVPKIGTDSLGVLDVLENASIDLGASFVGVYKSSSGQVITGSKIFQGYTETMPRLGTTHIPGGIQFKNDDGTYIAQIQTNTSAMNLMPGAGSNTKSPTGYTYFKQDVNLAGYLIGHISDISTNLFGSPQGATYERWKLSPNGLLTFYNNSGFVIDQDNAIVEIGNVNNVGSIWVDGTITATEKMSAPEFFISSDTTLKKNQEKLTDYEDINVYKYNWKTEDGKELYGFVAQEVEKEYPELVNLDEETSLKQVNYNAALALMIVKLNNRIKELEKKLEEK